MKNREVYLKNPVDNRLLNDGVAEVTDARSDAEMHTLRYELETEVFTGARVFQGGGQEVFGNDLADKVAQAARGSVVRLYPHFDSAGHTKWNKVIDRACKGDAAGLDAVDHTGEVAKHAVPAAILKFVGSGKKGSEIRKHFDDSPYGWPRDAIDGAIYALVASGDLRATDANHSLDGGGLHSPRLGRAAICARPMPTTRCWTRRRWTARSSPRHASASSRSR